LPVPEPARAEETSRAAGLPKILLASREVIAVLQAFYDKEEAA
jgi:hypothetical protein